jgi:hypothetical protein
LLVVLPSCAREEKVVRYKPFFANIADARQGQPPVQPNAGYHDPTAYSGESRIENPDGSVRLISKSVRQLMSHIERTLDDGDDDLFLEQLLSEETKRHYRGEGKDPADAVAYFHEHRRDIATLFARMPFGEYSPSIIRTKTGRNQWKFELIAAAKRDSPLTELWVALEDGEYRLIWIE